MKGKKIFIIFFVIALTFLFAETIHALEFDNIKNYDSSSKTVTIENSFLWIFPLGKIANITLETPIVNNVIAGKDRLVAEFTINDYNNYSDGIFDNMNFLDLKNNNKKIKRDFVYKYKIFKGIKEIPEYKQYCNEKISGTNNSKLINCTKEIINIIKEEVYEWKPLSQKELQKIPGKKITIGIFTDVEPGDYIEWIPTLYGVKINEWAIWQENLNANLSAYYSFNSGYTNVDIAPGSKNNLTIVGSPLNITNECLIGGCWTNFSGNNDYLLNATSTEWTLQNNEYFTINTWVKLKTIPNFSTANIISSAGASPAFGWNVQISNDGGEFFGFRNSGSSSIHGLNTPNTNVWYMITIIHNSSGIFQYLNGTFDSFNESVTAFQSQNRFHIGYADDGYASVVFNGTIDETGLWINRSMTELEINQLWNGGLGISYADYGLNLLDISLNSPENNINYSTNEINFNCSAISVNQNITNISLWINGNRNYSITGINNNLTELSKNLTLNEGVNNWTCSASGTVSNETFSTTNRSLMIDTTIPEINVTYPADFVSYQKLGNNLTINWTISDTNLGACLASLDNGLNNISVGCLDGNITINVTSYLNNSFTLFANDTVGNKNNFTRFFNYIIFQNNVTYNNLTTEGSTETFLLNFEKYSEYQVSTIKLNYNNSLYSSMFTLNGNNVAVSNIIAVPPKTNDIDVNFLWEITFTNGIKINTSFYNQSIYVIQIDNCTQFSNLIYNFSILDEESKTNISGTTVEVQINLYDSAKTYNIVNFSGIYSNKNPVTICSNRSMLNTINYSSDVVVKYYANYSGVNYAIRYYNILNQIISNLTVPKHINLYDLVLERSTDFQLTFKDKDLAFAPNILVNVYRQYVSDNDFKIVEIPLTDSNGQTVLHLVRNDVVYNFVMVNSSGDIVATFNKVIAFCQDYTIGSCAINLNALSEKDIIYDYTDDLGISYSTPVYSNVTDTVSFTFQSNNLSTVSVNLEVIKNNDFGNRTVCTNSITSSTGAVSCDTSTLTENDRYLFVNIYVNGGLKATKVIDIHSQTSVFGVSTGACFALLFVLLIICMFMEDKQALLVALALGWVVIISLGFLNGVIIGSVSGVVWLIICVIIMLWKLNKEEKTS